MTDKLNERFERYIKKAEPKEKTVVNKNIEGKAKRDVVLYDETDLFENAKEPIIKMPDEDETLKEKEPQILSLFHVFKNEGNPKWLDNDNPSAKASFNIINKTLYPERETARGIAVLAAKGTSFPEKREACLEMAINLLAGEATGEIHLVAEPTNPYDPNAVAIISTETNKMLGYIPKSLEINKTYAGALKEGKFCGGYIINTKRSNLKGEANAMLLIATGWL